jgi:Family of unknown function (DUF6069)
MTVTATPPRTTDRPLLRCLAVTVPSAVAASLTVWAVSRLGAVDLVVRSGDATRTVGWIDVAVASAVAAAAGTALLYVLRRRLRHGRAIGFWLATVFLVLSIVAGPLSATTTTAAAVLATMHAVVWGVVTAPARRRRSILAGN